MDETHILASLRMFFHCYSFKEVSNNGRGGCVLLVMWLPFVGYNLSSISMLSLYRSRSNLNEAFTLS